MISGWAGSFNAMVSLNRSIEVTSAESTRAHVVDNDYDVAITWPRR